MLKSSEYIHLRKGKYAGTIACMEKIAAILNLFCCRFEQFVDLVTRLVN